MSSASDWKIYRTRFLIKARQLDAPLAFTDPLGREHHGLKGDYLVESSDGLQRIAPREIFEDIYVPMGLVEESRPSSNSLGMSSPISVSHSELIQPSALHPTATRPAFGTDTVAAADTVLPASGPDRRARRRDSVRYTSPAVVASASTRRLDRDTGSGFAPPGNGRVSAGLSPRRPSTDYVRNFRAETA